MRRRRARAPAPTPLPERYVVVDDVLPVVPPGLVLEEPEPVALPEGEVVDDEPLPVVPVAEPEPVLRLPGDADGVVRSGVLPTRSVSVRLQAAETPASNARAQKPDSIFFISHAPPCGVLDQSEGLQQTCPQQEG